jgi:hypothetical protein
MRSFIIIIYATLIVSTVAFAQNRLHSMYGFRGSADGAILLPSTLDLKKNQVQLSGSGQFWLGNTFVSNKGLYQFFDKSSEIVRPDFDRAIDRMRDKNTFGLGLEGHTAISFQVPIRDHRFTFSIGVGERFGMNWGFSKNMLSLFWNGNKQWAGEKVELTPFAVNAAWYREFVTGAATEVYRSGDFYVRAGTRLKFIQSLAALHMPVAKVELTTAADGQYLLFDYDYDIRYAFGSGSNPAFSPSGGGFGIDLGLTVGLPNRITVDAALNDLGSMHFKNNANVMRKTSSFLYEGFDFNKLVGVSSTIYLDSLYKSLGFDAPQEGSFKMLLGSRLVLQGMYELSETDALKDKGRVFVTYVQGFREMPFSTRRAYLGTGYSVRLLKWLEIGTNAGFGGFNRVAIGLMTGMRIGKSLQLAFSSENVLGMPIPGAASGVDFGGNLVWNFGRYKHE